MILFNEDWDRYPYAIPNYDTKNRSFMKLAYKFQLQKRQNRQFFLALHNKGLKKVDPFSENLSMETISEIAEECRVNPWYSIREIIRAPGTTPEPIRLNRANLSLLWSFYNHVTYYALQPRQTGKSFIARTLTVQLLNFLTTNSEINWLLKDADLKGSTLDSIKDIENTMPEYLQFRTANDKNNASYLEVGAMRNGLRCYVGSDNEAQADRLGRGITSEILIGEEIAFIRNLGITLPIILSTGGDAREKAAKVGKPYGTVLLTTAGNPDDRDGKVAHDLYLRSADWLDEYYDLENREELHKVVVASRGKLRICGVFNHRQLGYTDEWLNRKIQEREIDPREDREGIERDYLNIWPRGALTSPFTPAQTKIIHSSVKEPKYVDIDPKYGLLVRWYIEKEFIDAHVASVPHVLALDSSDASGSDDIGLVLRNVLTGEVTAAGEYNLVNIITFCEWLVEWFFRFPNMILIPERRFNAGTMIDYFILALEAAGEDPFKRIFNRITDAPEEHPEAYEEICKPLSYRSPNLTTRYKKHFGFATSGSGYGSRTSLYGTVLKQAVDRTGTLINDKKISDQLLGLKKHNGRVDHAPNSNDDMAISWVLSYWFLIYANNTDFYGMDSSILLKDAIFKQDRTKAIKQEVSNSKIKKIKKLTELLKSTYDTRTRQIYTDQITKLYDELPAYDREAEINIGEYIQSLKEKNRRSRRSYRH